MQLLNNLFKDVQGKKNVEVICYVLTLLVSLQQGNVKQFKKLAKIVNIQEENLHILCTS